VLTAAQIMAAFERLAEVIAERGIRGDLFVVGGAAMAVAYQARTATKDVDAVFAPKTELYSAAEVVAGELGLPDGWLNDAVKAFVTRADPEAIPVLDRPSLRVTVASPRYLLAMKLLAGRPEQDADDIRFLAGLLRLTTSDEVLEVVTSVYPEARILPRTQFLVEELFGQSAGDEAPPEL
jgi:Nucleotidyltransferase of unknown function (DUF6036)